MESKKSMHIREIVLCAMFSALIAVGAFIRIPVPVVPFTLQFLFTNLAGLILGRRLGSISVAVYIAVGLAGLPVFTAGGGPAYIFQPTFGYIIGFLVGAYVAGYISDHPGKSPFKTMLAAGFVNMAIVYTFGMVYYYFIANYYTRAPIGVWPLILHCFILAAPGDIVTCFACAILVKRLSPMLKRGSI